MKNTTKIAFVVLVILVIAVIPLYYFTRPNAAQPVGTIQIRGSVANPANFTYAQLSTYPSTSMQVTK